MKIREHRGGLADSMKTATTCEPTREAVAKIVGVAPDRIQVKPYGDARPDDRIGWDATYMVLLDNTPWGFTDGPIRANLVDPIRNSTGYDKRTLGGSCTPAHYCYLCGRELKIGQPCAWIREDTSGHTRKMDEDIPEAEDMGCYPIGAGCARKYKKELAGFISATEPYNPV